MPSGRRRLSPAAIVAVVACALALVSMTVGEVSARRQREATATLLSSIVDRGDGGLRAEDDGRLVRIAGRADADAPLVDRQTGVTLPALTARRDVEMWQRIGRRGEDGRWRVSEGWSAIRELGYDGTADAMSRIANPPFPFDTTEVTAPVIRIGGVPVDRELGRRSQFYLFTPVPPSEIRDAVARHVPDRVVSVDGAFVVIAASAEAPTVGDVRLRYRAARNPREVAVVGRQQDGGVVFAAIPGIPVPVASGAPRLADMLSTAWRDGPGEAVFWGRAGGVVVLALALALVALGGLRRRPDDEGGGWRWGGFALAAASLDDTVGAVVGVVALAALVPFALAVAPVALGLGALAWWMAQGATEMTVGIAAAAAAALGVLVSTSRRDRATA